MTAAKKYRQRSLPCDMDHHDRCKVEDCGCLCHATNGRRAHPSNNRRDDDDRSK